VYCAPAEKCVSASPLFIAFSQDPHISSIQEVEEAAGHFRDATVLINPSVPRLAAAFEEPRTLVHIAGHAGIDSVGGKLSWIETPAGRLTGRDLTGMHIRAETLVVTGCQTARRMLRPGDEWLGLMRSFYMAGARAIVSAFWDIRAESARRFASEFYKHFDKGSVLDAARMASAVVREWEAHPYFWAGFGVFSRRGL
jgi:CHAT domain-containing protein